jgi:hypothetical protein
MRRPQEMTAGGSLGHGLVPGRLSPLLFSFFYFLLQILSRENFLTEINKIKTETNNTKINAILSMNAKACCYPYDEFYSPQNNLFAKFNAHKNT